MAINGFDTDYFVDALFAYAQAEFNEWAEGKTSGDIEELLTNIYPEGNLDDAAEAFYLAYGADWGIAPNGFFDAAEYRLAWAAKQVATNNAFTVEQALEAYDAAVTNNAEAYDHYVELGAKAGVNPSNDFDESDYIQSWIDGLDVDMTVAELRAALADVGITALDVYVDYPDYRDDYPAIPVTGDELVNVDPVVETFTLTENTDVATANIFNAGLVYTPGGDDRINALQDEDKLTGTGDNATLNAELGNANDNGNVIVTPELNNIETVNVAFTGSGGVGWAVDRLDLQDATGMDTLNITRISQAVNNVEVANIMTALTDMSIANTNANQAGGVELSFGNGVLLGDNTANLGLSNVNVNNVNIGLNTSGVAIANGGVATQGYENLTINSTGAANTIGILNVPMDTDTDGVIKITGDKDLTLAQTINVVNGATGSIESVNHAGGILQANGRLASVDASEFTGNLTLNIGAGTLTTNKAGTSGVVQNVSITGGTGNDTFYLGDVVQAGDSITGGDGTDTLVIVNGGAVGTTSSAVTSVESLKVELNATNGLVPPGTLAAAQTATVDFDKLASVADITVRNVSNNNIGFAGPAAPFAGGIATYNLNNLTAAQAAAISIMHSDSGSNNILNNILNANLKVATGTADTVAVTIAEGVNNDPRFNFILNAASVENLTLVDADSESNTVALGSFANHTGIVTIGTEAGTGVAGSFLNLDTTTAGANGGLYQYSTTGLADAAGTPAANGQIIDLSLTANQVKLAAATINASAELGNVIVRVSSNAASAVGAQTITMGAGNDTVIFDNVNDNRAGLTISDTVAGGAGTGDTLVIDGNLAVAGTITLGASEWTNVSGFETIRLVNPGAGSTYALTLTDSLIAANNNAGTLAIINDHDAIDDTGRTVAAAAALVVGNDAYNGAGQTEAAVLIDARSLSAASKFSYNGEEGTSRTADTFRFTDVNINGNAVIDGGAIDNITNNMGVGSTDATIVGVNGTVVGGVGPVQALANKGNTDVIEVYNAAVVSQGDLANVKNVGTLSFRNDLAVTQNSILQLNDTIVDSMVDSYQASTSRATAATTTTGGANVEVLQINAMDNINATTAVMTATTGITIEAAGLTDKSDLDITLGRGTNTVATGAGQDRVVILGNYTAAYAPAVAAGVVNGVNISAQANNLAGVMVAGANGVGAQNINLGTGTDTLEFYGGLNMASMTVANVENVIGHSSLVINASQLANITSLVFIDAVAHQLVIVDDVAGAIDLSKITVTGGTLQYNIVQPAAGGADLLTSNAPVIPASNAAGVAIINPALTAANVGGAVTPVGVVSIAGAGPITGTDGTNDTFVGAVADLNNKTIIGFGTDTETLSLTNVLNTTTIGAALGAGAATAGGAITNIDSLMLANGSNVVTIAAGTGIVSITGGTGDDNITDPAGAGNETILGGAGADTITSAGGNDYISGGAGIDSILFGATLTAADTVDGGTENDTLTISGAATATTDANLVNVENIVWTDTGAGDTFTFAGQTEGFNVSLSFAGTGTDSVTLGNGTNVITVAAAGAFGTAGSDTIVGGTGTDTLNLGHDFTDTLDGELVGIETIVLTNGAAGVGDFLSLTNQTEGFTITGLTGTAQTIVGGAGNDSITGGTAVDILTGGAGNDTIAGGGGNDVFTGGMGQDSLVAGAGADTFVYTTTVESTGATADTINGFNFAADFIGVVTNMTTTTFNANAGATGTMGFNQFNATNNTITVETNQGNLLVNLAGATNAPGGTGTLAGSAALSYSVTGTAGADTITTGAGNDFITGGAGGDTINTSFGNDTVVLAIDTDSMGAGADANTANLDKIGDFVVANDTIQLGVTGGGGMTLGGLTLTAPTTATVTAGGVLAAGSANITALTAAMQADTAGTASNVGAANLQVYTFSTAAGAGAFDGRTYLVINDDTAAIQASDTIIDITGVSGTLTTADFICVI